MSRFEILTTDVKEMLNLMNACVVYEKGASVLSEKKEKFIDLYYATEKYK